MKNRQDDGILYNDRQLGPFPTHRLKRVDKPTTLITDNIQRIDAAEAANFRVQCGRVPAGKRTTERKVDSSINVSKYYPLLTAMHDVSWHLDLLEDNQIAADKVFVSEDPSVISRHIKRLGYFLKADIMGICQLPKYAVYIRDECGNPANIHYKYAIVIVMRKDYETIYASTGYDWIGSPLSVQCYQRLASVAITVANYIRRLGYPALAQYATRKHGRYQVLIPPLLLWAGIGEISRAGIVLNPFLGLGLKAAAVLTNLPLVSDKPIAFGLQDFCHVCKVCAQECPSKAIPKGDKVIYNGYETWKLDVERCASFNNLNRKGTMCNKCVKVCPWTRPNTWPHNLVRWGVEHSNLVRRLAIKADDILQGRRQPHEKDKWWFDLE